MSRSEGRHLGKRTKRSQLFDYSVYFAYFYYFFKYIQNQFFQNTLLGIPLRVSNSLDSDQVRHFVQIVCKADQRTTLVDKGFYKTWLCSASTEIFMSSKQKIYRSFIYIYLTLPARGTTKCCLLITFANSLVPDKA